MRKVMKGLAFVVSTVFACSARAADVSRPSQATTGNDPPAAISDSNARGFNTTGSGVSQGLTDSSDPQAITILLSEQQRATLRDGRDKGHLPPGARKALDSLLKSPNASAFERQMEQGSVNYARPSGFDGRASFNEIGKSSLQRERSIPSGAASGRDFQSSQGRRNPVQRAQRDAPRLNHASPRDLGESMSPLEAGSRRAMRRAGGSREFRSLRDQPADFDPKPNLFAAEPRRAYRESERRARARLEKGRSQAAYSALAQSQIGLGNFKEARAAADRALAVNPKDSDALALRAIASEGLGDEAAKLASLEEAARLNPRRFSKLLEQARGGQTLFDPSAADSWGLLGALAETPERGPLPGRQAVGLLLGALVLAIPLIAGASAYRRLSPEAKRKTLGRWTKWVKGSATPKLTAPVRRPDGPSIVTLEPGLRVADKYKLIRRIGVDGTVQVWKALDKVLDRPVLMKQLYERRIDSGEWELRLSEAKTAATLHHPNIVDLYEILDMPIGLFVVYEYPSGKTLRDVIDEVGSLPLLQALDILIPVCRGLQHAHHRGVVHGALSPDRIVLTRQGYVKVTDFVLARTTGSDAGACVAPEAKRGEPTRASDIYSLGACLHEALTGKKPGEPGDETPDPRAESLLARALDLDGRTRIQSARVFQQELEELRLLLKKDSAAPSPRRPDDDQDQDDRGYTRGSAAS